MLSHSIETPCRNILTIILCWKSTIGMKNPSVRGGYGYHGQTHGVWTGFWLCFWKLHACGIFYLKMPWYYVTKKSILYSILRTQNTPTLCSNTPPKIGWDVTVGVFTLLVPIFWSRNLWKKTHLDGKPIFYGGLTFLFHQEFHQSNRNLSQNITVSYVCAQWDRHLLLITLLPCSHHGVYFCHTMMLAAAGSYRHRCHSFAQSKHKDPI